MKVLLATASLDPSHGGPPVAVSRLARALRDAGATVGVLTADRTADRPSPFKAPGVRYLSGGIAAAAREFGQPDVIHDHSLWDLYHLRIASFAAARGVPRLVSPFGCLQREALRISRFKKKIAWLAYQRRIVNSAQLIHATSQLEVEDIKHLTLAPPVICIPHGIDIPERSQITSSERSGTRRVALFLSRLHPVKGLPMLIAAWAKARPENWVLTIAGPDESGHGAIVKQAVHDAGLENVVSFLGPLEGVAKDEAFRRADLFVLPSYTENFGIVVAEALAKGIPVITTTRTPWRELDERGCGWCVPPETAAISAALQRAANLDPSALRAMGMKGREWMATDFGWDRIAQQHLEAYGGLITGKFPRSQTSVPRP